jgi:F-type H+-transporting ATPase subunit alpha
MSTFKDCLEKFNEFGIVEEIAYPVIKIKGLPHATSGELIVFENEQLGQVMILDEDYLEVVLLSSQPLLVGMQAARTGSKISVNVGDQLLGHIIDPLGNIKSYIDTDNYSDRNNNAAYQFIDIPPPGITQRYQITEPLLTGVSIIDLLLPLGKGQRELVVGDRKTGKTSFIFTVLKNQVKQGVVGIYVAIGKQTIEIEAARQWFAQQQILPQMIIVASTSQDIQSLIYLAPFAGMAIAEYFRDQGRDVVLVLDDLSTHAKFYREIYLLARRFPGRDSYPSDIFFTHARLLERAGNFIHPVQGTASISCLPVAETAENDLSDYIVSNLIGITDGHLLFDSQEFIKGHRPAVNSSLSVTRVGRQTQGPLHQDISQKLMAFMSQYVRDVSFSHFGSELTEELKHTLQLGNTLYSFFNQQSETVIPLNVQIVVISLIWIQSSTAWIKITEDNILQIIENLTQAYEQNSDFRDWVEKLTQNLDWSRMLDQLSAEKQVILNLL